MTTNTNPIFRIRTMEQLDDEAPVKAGRPRLGERAKPVAQRISQARMRAGFTVDECARALDISRSQYRYLEVQCGEEQEKRVLSTLAALFNVPLEWLAHGVGASLDSPAPEGMFSTLTVDEAQWLGARAKARREELSYSRNDLAAMIGVSDLNILTWERSLPRKRRPVELVWESALRVPAGWLRNVHLKAAPPPPFPILDRAQGMTVAGEMRAVCSWFSRKSPYHRTTDYPALAESEKRMVDIMLARFGIDGEDETTLQQIADRIGLTRERVRQIGEDFNANLDEQAIATPALDHLKAAIQSKLPCKVEELDAVYRDLLGESLSVAGADRFAREVLGKSVVRIVTNPANMQGRTAPMALPDDTPKDDVLRAVRQVAVSMVRISGAAQLHFVAGMSSTVLKRGVMPDEVARCCRVFGNFEWLSEEDGWFWFGPAADNRAKTAALKVLSVATRNVDVEEIHDAMARARITRYDPDRLRPYLLDAPRSVLTKVIARIPGIERLQFNDFRLDVLISPEEVLSDTELAILQILRRHGGIATRQAILEQVPALLDVTPVALNFALDGSPIFVRLDRGVWTIRGNSLNPEAMASALACVASSFGARKYFTDGEKPVDGWWRLRVAVPESAFVKGHWIVPGALARLLTPGDYVVDGYESRANFTVATNPNLGAFVGKLAAAGIQPKEVFLLAVHETERRLRFDRLPDGQAGTAATADAED